jgi:hypothetical protein
VQASIHAATKHERTYIHQRIATLKLTYLRRRHRHWYIPRNLQHRKRNREHHFWRHVATIILGGLERQTGNTALAAAVYVDPFTFALTYSIGTLERDVVVQAYRHVQRLLCVAGTCLSVLLIGFL